jgi:hypothetical protein
MLLFRSIHVKRHMRGNPSIANKPSHRTWFQCLLCDFLMTYLCISHMAKANLDDNFVPLTHSLESQSYIFSSWSYCSEQPSSQRHVVYSMLCFLSLLFTSSSYPYTDVFRHGRRRKPCALVVKCPSKRTFKDSRVQYKGGTWLYAMAEGQGSLLL